MDRANYTWCLHRSMTNTSSDFALLLKVAPKMILVNDLCAHWPHIFNKLKSFVLVLRFALWNFADTAWDIITDFATELLEKEQADEITEMLDRKRKETLEKKRSFFVRMVSDPKIYNPAINKAGTPRMSSENYSPIAEGAPSIQTPLSRYICVYFSIYRKWLVGKSHI